MAIENPSIHGYNFFPGYKPTVIPSYIWQNPTLTAPRYGQQVDPVVLQIQATLWTWGFFHGVSVSDMGKNPEELAMEVSRC